MFLHISSDSHTEEEIVTAFVVMKERSRKLEFLLLMALSLETKCDKLKLLSAGDSVCMFVVSRRRVRNATSLSAGCFVWDFVVVFRDPKMFCSVSCYTCSNR
jgi:hypothetical protein